MALSETARPPLLPPDLPLDGADLVVAQFVAAGVETLFINSGTDTFPVQEAIAKRQALGLTAPRVVLCLDEMVAAAAAHGHFLVSGKPQAVLVHVDVGTQQLGGAVHNAQRSRIGMLLCAGRAPFSIDGGGEFRKARKSHIHWIQEQRDQAGIVRTYTKWEYELRSSHLAGEVVQRAWQVAASAPAGPVYLVLPLESLLDPAPPALTPPERFPPLAPPAPRPELIEQAADLLAAARAPLIVTGMTGVTPAAVAALVELTETLGAPVVSDGSRLSFPTTHPLWADSGDGTPLVAECDVLLSLDIEVPYIPARAHLPPTARHIKIDLDPVNPSVPLQGFPVDLAIQADSALALPALTAALRERLRHRQEEVAARATAVAAANAERQRRYRALAHARRDELPISPLALFATLGDLLDDEWTLLDEAVGASAWLTRLVPRTRPGSLYKSGGSSLGWALGAAVGVKLAEPERLVVAVMGDGTFVYGCPTAALWAADVQQTPFLTVINNNRQHAATRNALRMGYPESYAERTGSWPGILIDPPPDYAAIARACRAHGETVDRPEELEPALRRAIAAVRNGQAAVVDVRTTHVLA
ncbi:MAG: thiamine pyrophosphate-requiring protein [Chloroflexi bacterium]|nr:thiamine pyrophosphate-requiring protein [Chloroflexota bacterium]